jgi:hypothetical protein
MRVVYQFALEDYLPCPFNSRQFLVAYDKLHVRADHLIAVLKGHEPCNRKTEAEVVKFKDTRTGKQGCGLFLNLKITFGIAQGLSLEMVRWEGCVSPREAENLGQIELFKRLNLSVENWKRENKNCKIVHQVNPSVQRIKNGELVCCYERIIFYRPYS